MTSSSVDDGPRPDDRAVRAFAVAKKRSGMRIASIVASGTWTAILRSGLRCGSSRSASSRLTRRAGMPLARQASKKSGS